MASQQEQLHEHEQQRENEDKKVEPLIGGFQELSLVAEQELPLLPLPRLPDDVLVLDIFLANHVVTSPSHVTTLSLVCKQWRQMLAKHMYSQRVWKELWLRKWPEKGLRYVYYDYREEYKAMAKKEKLREKAREIEETFIRRGFKKGDHLVLRGHPVKLVESHMSKTGKHGMARWMLRGVDLLTHKKVEEVVRSSMRAQVRAPVITKKECYVFDCCFSESPVVISNNSNNISSGRSDISNNDSNSTNNNHSTDIKGDSLVNKDRKLNLLLWDEEENTELNNVDFAPYLNVDNEVMHDKIQAFLSAGNTVKATVMYLEWPRGSSVLSYHDPKTTTGNKQSERAYEDYAEATVITQISCEEEGVFKVVLIE